MMKYLKNLFVLMLWLPCTYLLGQDVGNPVLKQEKNYKLVFEGEPLYLVNGKKVDKKALDTLKTPFITYVEIMKPPKSIEQYGEEGKNGVILLFSKHKEDIKEKD